MFIRAQWDKKFPVGIQLMQSRMERWAWLGYNLITRLPVKFRSNQEKHKTDNDKNQVSKAAYPSVARSLPLSIHAVLQDLHLVWAELTSKIAAVNRVYIKAFETLWTVRSWPGHFRHQYTNFKRTTVNIHESDSKWSKNTWQTKTCSR